MHAAKNVSQSQILSKSHGQKGNGAGDVPLPNPTPVAEIVDIQFESQGSIVLIRGLSKAGQTWLDQNVGDDETQYFGNAIAAEPRYCPAIAEGATEAGLVVR